MPPCACAGLMLVGGCTMMRRGDGVRGWYEGEGGGGPSRACVQLLPAGACAVTLLTAALVAAAWAISSATAAQ